MTLLTEPMPAVPLVPSPQADPDFDWIDAPDGLLYELVDGKPVEKRVSATSMWIATRISHLISRFLDDNDVGFVFVEQPVLGIWQRPRHGRRPDVCYVSRARMPALPPVGEIEVAPDLAIEVVSPHDNLPDFEDKLQEYLLAGVKQIWVIYPRSKTVRVYQSDGNSRLLNITGTLDGETALPGFTCPVVDIFPKA